MLLKTQEILLETQGNLFKTQDTGAFEHNQAPKNRTNKKPALTHKTDFVSVLPCPEKAQKIPVIYRRMKSRVKPMFGGLEVQMKHLYVSP